MENNLVVKMENWLAQPMVVATVVSTVHELGEQLVVP